MPQPLQIGKCDRRITIQRLTESQGEHGEPTEAYTDWTTVWANKYESGREFEAARQINPEIATMFQIRYLSGLSATMRISYDGKFYDIDHFVEVGRRDRLNIFAKARQV